MAISAGKVKRSGLVLVLLSVRRSTCVGSAHTTAPPAAAVFLAAACPHPASTAQARPATAGAQTSARTGRTGRTTIADPPFPGFSGQLLVEQPTAAPAGLRLGRSPLSPGSTPSWAFVVRFPCAGFPDRCQSTPGPRPGSTCSARSAQREDERR